MSESPVYVLGHDAHELERLQLQSQIIGGVTRRLIRECGITRGMRVLEIGCGAGDVSLLLAEAVGETGRVVGFDREARAVGTARARAAAAGYRNVEFVVTADDALPELPLFDAAFGRYVLVHQPNPVAMVRRVAAAVRPGGIVAFHEVALHLDSHTQPRVELYHEVDRRMVTSFRRLLPHHDVGGRLVEVFAAAGLPAPHLIWESIAFAGAEAAPMWRWFAMSYFSMLPHIQKLGLTPVEENSLDRLVDRLLAQATQIRAQVVSRPQACAWAVRS